MISEVLLRESLRKVGVGYSQFLQRHKEQNNIFGSLESILRESTDLREVLRRSFLYSRTQEGTSFWWNIEVDLFFLNSTIDNSCDCGKEKFNFMDHNSFCRSWNEGDVRIRR